MPDKSRGVAATLGRRVVFVAAALLFLGHRPAIAFEPSVNYMLQCMGCHTPDGSGEPGRVPSVRRTLVPFSKLAQGRRFLIQVPGSAQSTLSDAELADLLNWMVLSLGQGSSPEHLVKFTEAEVARYRRTPLIDVKGTRQRLLALPEIRKSIGAAP